MEIIEITNPVSSGVILHKQTYPQINKIILFKHKFLFKNNLTYLKFLITIVNSINIFNIKLYYHHYSILVINYLFLLVSLIIYYIIC